MLGIYVSVPVTCFRKGLAREYLETEALPPPSTCYGFLLSLVGETDRRRHVGTRVTAGLIGEPDLSVVLRTVWRVKSKPLGAPGNTRPDYQQLLSNVRLIVWLDSTDEAAMRPDVPTLEDRVRIALDPTRRREVGRFGGLSLGESTHLVDDVLSLDKAEPVPDEPVQTFLLADRGRLTLPVWVDHVGSAGTRYATGTLVRQGFIAPAIDRLPVIQPAA